MIDRHSPAALLTDKYELTVLQASLADGFGEHQVALEVFGRRPPNEHRYGVVAGTARVLEAIRNFRFIGEQLASLNFLDDRTLDYLRNYSFSSQTDDYRERGLCFLTSPILTVRGTFTECVILETVILSILNADSIIASATTRTVAAAGGRPVIETGSCRTHEEAAVTAAHAAYLTGFSTTSSLEAAARYNTPASGTAAHAWTLLHTNPDGTTNEAVAFKAQTGTLGADTTLLVDTYDITEGVNTTIEIAGPELGSIRINSGDLGVLARQVRQQLDPLGAHNTNIIVSSDLDEFAIMALKAEPVDVYDVGIPVVTGSDAPAAGLVYRMTEVDGVPVAKHSLNKRSHGGVKTAIRTCRRSGTTVEGIAFPPGSEVPDVGNLHYRGLIIPMMRDGEVVGGLLTLEESRDHLVRALVSLPWGGFALSRDEPVLPVRFRGV